MEVGILVWSSTQGLRDSNPFLDHELQINYRVARRQMGHLQKSMPPIPG
jgi:hypothetical protein